MPFHFDLLFQFEYVSQHLVFANCIPLILKFFNQNILSYITANNRYGLWTLLFQRAGLGWLEKLHCLWACLSWYPFCLRAVTVSFREVLADGPCHKDTFFFLSFKNWKMASLKVMKLQWWNFSPGAVGSKRSFSWNSLLGWPALTLVWIVSWITYTTVNCNVLCRIFNWR